jgi:hypothetical protein
MRRKVLLLLSLSACILFTVGSATPKTASPKCLYPVSIDLRMRMAKAVFSGKVLDVKRNGEVEEVRLKILRSWSPLNEAEVLLLNYPESEAGISYKLGESYLVFAGGIENQLTTGTCPHVELLRYARGTIRQIERWQRQHRVGRGK